MTEARFCIPCGGSGKQLGGGMMITDCDNCNGSGKHNHPEDEIDYLLKKDTEHYKSAKKRIKSLNSKLTDEEVEKILDGELEKLNTASGTCRAKIQEFDPTTAHEFRPLQIGDEVQLIIPEKFQITSEQKKRGRPKVNKND